MYIFKSFIPRFFTYWKRRAMLHSLKKWRYFEFWPAPLFYLPIIPCYVYFSIKYRSLLAPFYANPNIENGGLIGESKWDFLKYLDPQAPATLLAFRVSRGSNPHKNIEQIEKQIDFRYPMICKPDVGQRGFGVRIIRDTKALLEYLQNANFDVIVQKFSQYPKEAGIFYVRHPKSLQGEIFSITDKEFPTIIGDGISRMGDLILRDRRASMIAATYFARFEKQLDRVLKKGEVFSLVECGNHSQGTIFLNGKNLNTELLRLSIEKIALSMGHFYFGRFDIRYESAQALMKGENFEIVEVNGAGSEATHIWDAKTTLIQAYRTLFQQWGLLFAIGDGVKKQKIKARISILKFLKESIKVHFNKKEFLISS